MAVLSPDGEPVWRRAGRSLFDRLEQVVADSRLPARLAIATAAALGAARARLSGQWPAPAEIAALFGTRRAASRRIASGIGALEARNRLTVRRLERRSLEPFEHLVRWRDPRSAAALRPPAILVSAHVGALHLLAVALDRLAGRRLVLRWSSLHEPGPTERVLSTAGGLESRANVLREALAQPRAGSFVLTLLDGEHGAGVPVRVLDRPARFGRGAFLLARQGQAPLVPVAARWIGTRVVCGSAGPSWVPTKRRSVSRHTCGEIPHRPHWGWSGSWLLGPAFEDREPGLAAR